jgi:AraC family transcriptional regulator of adaptative response/methylated-DNA-[protein]-cysteine methyltransferase
VSWSVDSVAAPVSRQRQIPREPLAETPKGEPSLTMLPLDEGACWDAVCRRDPSWDGRFLFGVLTTGVFCHPSCAARRPLRKNVRFYETAAAAARDGLRPCRRCRPDAFAGGGLPAWVVDLCAALDRAGDEGETLTLEALSRRAGLSPAHLQRTFRAVVGVTPRQYAERRRLERFKGELRSGAAVTEAIYAAGFGSSSRLYESADRGLGMRPGDYRAGGRGVTIGWAAVDTSLGPLLLAATDRGLCAVQLGGTVEELHSRLAREYPHAELKPVGDPPPPAFVAWMDALRDHLEGARPHPGLPLDVRATAFQQRVWAFLQTIPWGETRSYSEVAAAIGRPRAVRAVARACAANPVALAVPCHRVLRGDGELAGYRWGVERKRELLARERKGSSTTAGGG